MAEDGIQVDGESGQTSLNPETIVIQQASDKGWTPLEDYIASGKDPKDWVDAKEFVGREFLYHTIRDLKKELRNKDRKFEQDMEVISKQFAQMSDQAYRQAMQDLKAEKALAIEERDVAAVEKIDERILEAEKAHAVASKPVPVTPAESIEMQEWKGKNEWFSKDKELTDEAVSIGIGYIAAHKGKKTESEMLDYVEDRIKKIYPEKFQGKTTVKKDDSVAVESSGSQSKPTAKGKNGKVTTADLSEQELTVMKTFVKRGAFKHLADKQKISQEDVYLNMIAEQRAKERN